MAASPDPTPRVALLYPGDRAARDRADPAASRFADLFAALAAAGLAAEPAVWHDDFAGEVAEQLQRVQAVLVWCNPIEGGRRRDRLDALLAEVARRGVLVSAHPQAVQRLGTKDVLLQARELPFGSDVHRVDSLAQLEAELPLRLLRGPRVLKQHRGHSGIGVWRVQALDGALNRAVADPAAPAPMLTVRHAQRGSPDERMDLPALLARMAPYFEAGQGGHLIDQAWQPRLAEGMVRAYLVEDRVVGFGRQALNALLPAAPGQPAPAPGPRLYHGPEAPAWQGLRQRLQSQWIEQLRAAVGLAREHLPLLWDCDFLLGEGDGDGRHGDEGDGLRAGQDQGEDKDRDVRYVLCEVNVSSVAPFPPSAIDPLVRALQRRLARPPA
ncbi:MAG: Cj0069 family protein [Burkholderiales bacterium]|nr:Cj0069 family protein [Burkholderiales bacterium]